MNSLDNLSDKVKIDPNLPKDKKKFMDMSDCQEETHPLFVLDEEPTHKIREYKNPPPEPPPCVLYTCTHSHHHLKEHMLKVETSETPSNMIDIITTQTENNTTSSTTSKQVILSNNVPTNIVHEDVKYTSHC